MKKQRTKFKSILSFVLAAAMVMGMSGTTSLAAEVVGQDDGDPAVQVFSATEEDQTLIIKEAADGEIPADTSFTYHLYEITEATYPIDSMSNISAYEPGSYLSYVINTESGEETDTTNSAGTFRLKVGESAEFTLPAGTDWFVEQDTPKDYPLLTVESDGEHASVVNDNIGVVQYEPADDTGNPKPDADVDKSALQAEYDTDVTLNESDYTPESWAPFAEALENAKKVLADPDATQDEVDQALKALQDAKDGLKKVDDSDNNNPETVTVTVTKTWDDSDNQDGIRPGNVTVNLLADGDVTESVDMAADTDGSWTYAFTELPKENENGSEIAYTVTEDAVEGYETTVDGYNITNTHTPATVNISGTKVWEDNDNQDGVRPDSVDVMLLADGSVVANTTAKAEDNWAFDFGTQPKYASGTEIAYDVIEGAVNDYSTTYDVAHTGDDYAFTVTNAHTPETTSLTVLKVWSDADDQDGIRPENVTVTLLQNDVPTDKTLTLSEENDWMDTFTDLPKYQYHEDTGETEKYTYSIKEIDVEGYESTTTQITDEAYVCVNEYTPQQTAVTVNKKWDDADDHDGVRPESVEIQLLAKTDGDTAPEVVGSATLTEAGNWSGTFSSLPVYKDHGKAITYTVSEELIPDTYDSSITGDPASGFTITNTHAPQKTDISVTKVWEDNDNQDKARPDSVEVSLVNEETGVSVGEPLTLNEENKWSGTFTDVAKGADYTVTEGDVDGYTAEVTGDAESGFTVTNTHVTGTVDVSVEKEWVDNENADSTRPDSVTVHLWNADTETHLGSATLEEANGWAYTWADQPEKANGEKIDYEVTEEAVAGYDSEVSGDVANGFTVTNTYNYNEDTIEVTGTKVWKDNANQDGLRPDHVTIELLADDGTVAATQNVTPYTTLAFAAPSPIMGFLAAEDVNEWNFSFKDLPKYDESGSKITYTLKELEVENYDSEITGDMTEGFTITNTHTPATITVSGTKSWDDSDNQDGLQPEYVIVYLTIDGARVEDGTGNYETAVLTSATTWSYSFTGLAKYANGKAIAYGVEEEAVTGYEPTYASSTDEAGNYTIDITNTHTVQTINVSFEKVWEDNDNQDNEEPDSITVRLLANGTQVARLLVDAEDDWSGTFTDLPVYEGGKEIAYTVAEDPVEGYTTEYGDLVKDAATGDYSVTIKNTHTPDKETLTINKVWADNSDQDGIRPDPNDFSVNVLHADDDTNEVVGTISGEDWTVAGDVWTATLDVDTYENGGQAIRYKVEEPKEPDGYTVTYGDADPLTVINTHTPETTSVTVDKVWDDSENQDGVRHEVVTVRLYANGAEVANAHITADEAWSYTFTDLPKYANGVEITYTVTEDAMSDYTPAYNYAEGESGDCTITNTHTPDKTFVNVTKAWDDAGDQDGMRPTEVTVQLYADGTAVEGENGTVTLDDSNNWTGTFTDLDEYKDGNKIAYTVEETAVGGYTAAITGDATEGYTITNVHTPETVDITGQKVWEDDDNADGFRPDSVTVTLQGYNPKTEQSVEVTAANGWNFAFTDLPAYEGGKEITYTISEDEISGYTPVISDPVADADGNLSYTITNTHAVEPVTISVEKVWEDNDNADETRPDSVTVHLWNADTETHLGSLTLTESDDWEGAFEAQPRYADGKEITYEVTEEAVDGYTTDDITIDENGKATITNTYAYGDTIDITGQKVWEDNDDQDGLRPDHVTVELLADGTVAATQNITPYTTLAFAAPSPIMGFLAAEDVNEWNFSFKDLPKYNTDGSKIDYTINELTVEGYETAEITGDMTEGFTITNTHTPETISVSGTKTWDDNDNQDGLRPNYSVDVYLTIDGTRVDDGTGNYVTAVMNEGNGWTYSFRNLDKYANGKAIAYGVEEEAVKGYEPTYASSTDEAGNYTIDITNTHTVQTINVSFEKVWEDNDNQDNEEPDSITVRLLANGTQVARQIVDAEDDWSGTFTDLPVYADGKEITYTITEDAISGYTPAISDPVADTDGNLTFTITNTYNYDDTIDITGTKVWEDNNDQDGMRPNYVTIELLADGTVAATQDVTPYTTLAFAAPSPIAGFLAAEDVNEWNFSFKDLPKYDENGSKITYTIKELSVDEYTSTCTGDMTDGFTITNTHTPATITVSGTKEWADSDNQDNRRPSSITLQLMANGQPATDASGNARYAVATADDWTWEFDEVDQYADGAAIDYSVEEVAVDGYDASYEAATDEGGNYTITITNTYTPETIDISFDKVWDDNDDMDGARPNAITVRLYADGTQVDYALVNGADDDWSGSFTGLPKYKDQGTLILYTVTEDAISGYSTEYAYTGSEDTYDITITNTHTPDQTSVTVTKAWDDAGDQDGKRPTDVTVQLYADGIAVEGENGTVTLDNANNWTAAFTGLDEYEFDSEDHGGQEIVYTVAETDVPDGYTSETTGDATTGYVITNSYEPETVDITVNKVWDDNDNQDGVQHEVVTVRVYADGTEVASDNIAKVDDWTYTFTGLPKYANGTEITYTVTEDAMSNYTHEDIVLEGVEGGYAATVTNTHTPGKTNVSVTKAWDDNNDQDGIQPESVEVQLYADGVATGQTLTLSATDDTPWTGTFSDLDEYKDGSKIAYTVEETAVDGYTAAITGDATAGYTITNVHVPATVDITGQKVWEDNNDHNGNRPDSITVTLLADGTPASDEHGNSLTAIVDDDYGWHFAFTDMPKYDGKDGDTPHEIEYTLQEGGVPANYTSEVTGSVEEGFVITNTEITPVCEINGTVYTSIADALAAAENGDTIKMLTDTAESIVIPAGLEVTLDLAGCKISSDGNESAEEATGSYKAVIVNEGTLTLTDSVGDGTVDAGGTEKVAAVSNDIGATCTIDGGTFATDSYYCICNQGDMTINEGVTVTSTDSTSSMIENGFYKGIDENQGEATATLTINGGTFDGGKYNVKNDEYGELTINDGTFINPDEWGACVLNWNETTINGGTFTTEYVTLYTATDEDGTTDAAQGILTINGGSFTSEYDCIIQADSGSTVKITDGTFVLEDLDNWGATLVWEDTPGEADILVSGGYYNKQFDTDYLPEGKVESVFVDTEGTLWYYVEDAVTISGEKVWEDSDNQDGARPDEITLSLYANGEFVTSTDVTAQEEEPYDWTFAFGEYAKKAYGTTVTYTVVEDAVEDYTTDYDTVVDEDGNYDVTITNTHEPETVTLHGTKIWVDNNNHDGLRPESITLNILADGDQAYDKDGEPITVEVTAPEDAGNGVPARLFTPLIKMLAEDEVENSWTWSVSDLPKYGVDEDGNGGAEIEYTIEEPEVADYESYTTGDAENGFAIFNVHETEKVEIAGEKIWEDDENRDGVRPDVITIHLMDGEGAEAKEVAKQNITADDVTGEWLFDFTDLDKYDDEGEEIAYTLTETMPDSLLDDGVYTSDGFAPVEDTEGILYEVTNTHEPALYNGDGALSVTAEWPGDNETYETEYPVDSIEIALYANGAPVLDDSGEPVTITLDANGDWTGTFTDLYQYEDGEEIAYTVEVASYNPADSESGYTLEIVPNVDGTFTIVMHEKYADLDEEIVPDEDDPDSWTDEESVDAYSLVEFEMSTTLPYVSGEELVENGYSIVFHDQFDKDEMTLDEDTSDFKLTIGGKKVSDDYYTISIGDGTSPTSAMLLAAPAISDDCAFHVEVDLAALYNDEVITDEDLTGGTEITLYFFADIEGEDLHGTFTSTAWYELYEEDNDTPLYTSEHHVVTVTTYEIVVTKYDTAELEGDGYEAAGLAGATLGIYYDEACTEPVLRGGEPYTAVSGEENGATTFYGLAYEDNYYVQETEAPDGYELNDEVLTVDLTQLEADTYQYADPATLHYADTFIPVRDFTVTKVWEDDNDRDVLRPESVEVSLLANNEVTEFTATLSKENTDAEGNWTTTFENVPIYANDEVINYTVTETMPTSVSADAYETEIEYTEEILDDVDVITGATITNTHEPETVTLHGTKIWADENDNDGVRPEAITLDILADGSPALDKDGDPITVEVTAPEGTEGVPARLFTPLIKMLAGDDEAATNRWTWSIELPKYNGIDETTGEIHEIEYTVDELSVLGYTTYIEGDAESGFEVFNVYERPSVSYAVKVWGINRDTYSEDGGETLQNAGLTFGPATGADHLNDYVSRDTVGETAHPSTYCIHDMTWEEIIAQAAIDPTVFNNCKENGCTKSVELTPNATLFNMETACSAAEQGYTGDGVSTLRYLFNADYRSWNASYTGSSVNDPSNVYSRSRIRTVLTGDQANITEWMSEDDHIDYYGLNTLPDAGNCLLSCFPEELQNAVVPRTTLNTGNATTGSSINDKTTYDKLFLFSVAETGIATFGTDDSGGSDYGIRNLAAYEFDGTEASSCAAQTWWTRARSNSTNTSPPLNIAYGVNSMSGTSSTNVASTNYGVSPSFCLPGPDAPVIEGDVTVTAEGLDENNTKEYDGKTVTLTAAVDSVTPADATLTYQWYKLNADTGEYEPIDKATEATLTLSGDVSDTGTYRCEVTATSGGLSATASGEIEITITAATAKYAVKVWGINRDTYSEDGGETLQNAGLTFGPALGKNYIQENYVSKETVEEAGGDHDSEYCIHDMTWDEIIAQAAEDPTVFNDCKENGCTKTVELTPNEKLFNETTVNNAAKRDYTGDGVSTLYYLLNGTGSTSSSAGANWNLSPEVTINPDDLPNIYSRSRIRATLTGDSADAKAQVDNGGYDFYGVDTMCDASNCLLSCFPAELQSAMVPRTTVNAGNPAAGSTANDKTTYDKLFLFSLKETGITYNYDDGGGDDYGVNDGGKWAYEFAAAGASSTSVRNCWSRSRASANRLACIVDTTGVAGRLDYINTLGLSPGFCLPGPDAPVVGNVTITASGLDEDKTKDYDGKGVTLTAAVESVTPADAELSYQWYKLNAETGEYEPIDKATEATLELTGDVSDTGTYRCEVTATSKGVSATASGDITITIHGPEKLTIHGTKVWEDNNDNDGVRPESITLYLVATVADTTTVTDMTVTAGDEDSWEWSFDDLSLYENGEEIQYHVAEAAVDGYSAKYDYVKDVNVDSETDESYNVTITNTHDPEKTSLTVAKIWDDDNNSAGLRPDKVEVQLLRANDAEDDNPQVVSDVDPLELSETSNWTGTFTDLPKYHHEDGEEVAEYVYSVQEVLGDDTVYTASDPVQVEDTTVYTITNSYTPEKTHITVYKEWEDGNDQDGKRPESVTINLLAGEEPVVDANGEPITATVSDATHWTAEFVDLPVYENGKAITYSVSETMPESVEEDTYEPEIVESEDGDGYPVYTITNIHEPETLKLSGVIDWDDDSDAAEKRPESVTINILADGEAALDEKGDPITVTVTGEDAVSQTSLFTPLIRLLAADSNEWAWSSEDLPKYKDGKEIEYTLKLDAITGYLDDIEQSEEQENYYTITLRFATLNYAVKIWGINADTYSEDGGETLQNAGLTFGPATGADYTNSYAAHLTEDAYNGSGDAYCIHWMTWDEIIEQAAIDPTVFNDCKENGCTKAVELSTNADLFNMDVVRNATDQDYDGDGVSVLYYLLNGTGSGNSQAIWNSSSAGAGESDPANVYSRSRIRTTLTGDQENINAWMNAGGHNDYYGVDTLYDETNCLLSCFPSELQNAMVPRSTENAGTPINGTSYGDETTYDKLFLFSMKEAGYASTSEDGGGKDYGIDSRAAYEFANTNAITAYSHHWWTRSRDVNNVDHAGQLSGDSAKMASVNDREGLAPGFCLPGPELTGSITVNLTDDSDPAEPLAGATFALYRVNADGSTGDLVISGETDENGQAVFTGLAWGVTYRIVQTGATTGYDVAENLEDITLTQDALDQTISVINLMAGNQVKYAVAIYGINQDVDEDGNPLGLTFGPATGADYIHEHNSHLTEEEYESGEYGICLHWMTWDEIIAQSKTDPTAFQNCLENGCTHSVHVLLDDSILGDEHTEEQGTNTEMQGDGAGMLLDCINSSYRWWNGTASNEGGWPASLVRATLNGADDYTTNGNVTGNTTPLTEENCLLSCFPTELQDNIAAKAVKSDTVYNSQTEENNQTTYDKLWLFSGEELYGYVTGGTNNGVIRTNEGALYQRSEHFEITTNNFGMLKSYGEYDNESSSLWWWLRSPATNNSNYVYGVSVSSGDWLGDYAWLDTGAAQHGLAPGFCLPGPGAPVFDGDVTFTTEGLGEDNTKVYDGEPVTLTAAVDVTPADAELSYQWYKLNADNGEYEPIDDATDATLTLAGNVSDTGTYKCEVTAANGERTASESGEITITITEEPYNVKYAVTIYGINQDVDAEGNLLGLTFGPATGADYTKSYAAHLTEDQYNSGEDGICLHWMTWGEIIEQSKKDPTAFQNCLQNGCTHSVKLNLNSTLLNTTYTWGLDGDGAGLLYESFSYKYRRWNLESSTTSGGWPASRVRATLNGADTYTDEDVAGNDVLTEENCLLSCFPSALQKNIVAKAVKSDTVYNDTTDNSVTTQDKLWLFSGKELYGQSQYSPFPSVIRENEGELSQRSTVFGITTNNYSKMVTYDESGNRSYDEYMWLRSLPTNSDENVVTVYSYNGQPYSLVSLSNISGLLNGALAPGFCLPGPETGGQEEQGKITLTLTDSDNYPLAGGTFTLYRVVADGDDEVVETGLVTDENGTLTVTGLSAGSYYFVETEAPEGHALLSGPTTTIEITENNPDGNITVTNESVVPFAVYCADENSLTFYMDTQENVPEDGGTYKGSTATNVYTGFTDTVYTRYSDVPWNSVKTSAYTVSFDVSFKACRPTATAYWFYGFSSSNNKILDLTNLNTSEVTTMTNMFYNCQYVEELDVSGFDTSNVTDMSYMFYYVASVTELDVSGFDTSNVTDMAHMFARCKAVESLDLSNFDTSHVEDMTYMFEQCNSLTSLDVSGFDTASVTTMARMFNSCSALTLLNVTELDTSSVTDMSYMFSGCSELTSLDVSDLDTESVTTMYQMFYGCSGLESLDVSAFDTSSVTTMTYMFYNCSGLSTLDISKFDTSSVTTMEYMFDGCTGLTSYEFPELDMSNVTDMKYMFYGCTGLTSVVFPELNTAKLKNLNRMFYGCTGLTVVDVSGLDTSSVTDMGYMFSGCTNLATIYSDDARFVTSKVTSSTMMFYNCNNLVGGNGTHYSSTSTNYAMAHVDAEGNPGYFTAKLQMFAVYCNGDESLTFYGGTSVPDVGDTYDGKTVTAVYEGFDTAAYTSASEVPWNSSCTAINTVTLDPSFAGAEPVSTAYWFDGFTSCNEISGLNYLKTTRVTDMSYMFYGCSSVTDLDVSGFDTASVTDMSYMFYNCSGAAELDVMNFNTENVTDMEAMFYNCSSVTQLDVATFDTSGVTDMDEMFYGCSKLATIYSDDTYFVTTAVVSGDDMFAGCENLVGGRGTVCYNADDGTYNDVTSAMAHVDTTVNPGYFTEEEKTAFAVYCIDDYTLTFYADDRVPTQGETYRGKRVSNVYTGFDTEECHSAEDVLWYELNFGIGSVKFDESFAVIQPASTAYWFDGLESCESIIGLGYLDTTNEKDMSYMFYDCPNLKVIDIEDFETSHVEDMSYMFARCESLIALEASHLDTSSVTNMSHMFDQCSSIEEIDTSGWDTSKVTDMSYMFQDCESLGKLDVSKWDTSNVTDMSFMFAANQNYIDYPLTSLDVSNWDTSSVTNTRRMFYYCEGLSELDVSNWDTSSVTDIREMFWNCRELTELDVSDFDTLSVENMYGIFYGCGGLTELNVSKWNTSGVTSMQDMFYGCSGLTSLDVANWDTSSVTNMSYMFNSCSGFTALDLSGWDTSNVTTMYEMFQGCKQLTSLDASNWDTSSVTNMQYMFQWCSCLNSIDVSKWDTSSVTDMRYMFASCEAITELDVSGWNTAKVTNMSNMFAYCYALATIYSDDNNFVTSGISSSSSGSTMFFQCEKLVGGNGTTYSSSSVNYTMAHVDTQQNPGYFTAKED